MLDDLKVPQGIERGPIERFIDSGNAIKGTDAIKICTTNKCGILRDDFAGETFHHVQIRMAHDVKEPR